MLRVVVDTNVWIRALLGGKISLPVLIALREREYQIIVSEALIEELLTVCQRPRLTKRIDPFELGELVAILRWNAKTITLTTIPPRCRDPKDHPVLATAIDGNADAIVTGDDDLRADDELRKAMAAYGVELWGVRSLLHALGKNWPLS